MALRKSKINHFLDIRNHGFHRVATISPRVHLADPQQNVAEHIVWLKKAYAQGVEYVLFPELSLTGYSCGVLFRQQMLRSAALMGLDELVTESNKLSHMIFSVGLPLVVDGILLNVVVTINSGKILAVVPKMYPPEGNEFDEARYFGRATDVTATTVTLFGQTVPFGNDILIAHETDPGFVIFNENCEDGWVPIPPSATAALHGAVILTNSSASNYVIGKDEYRKILVQRGSGPTQAVYMYVSAGYGETSSGMTWDNDAYIAERGSVLAQAKRFQRKGWMTIADVDTDVLLQERLNQSSFRQNTVDHQKAFRRATFSLAKKEWRGAEPFGSLLAFRREIDPLPFVPKDPATLDKRCEDVMNGLAMALARRLEHLPEHMRSVYFGYSGGRDSTLALLLAIRAMDILGLPRTNIVCSSLPGFGTSDNTKAIARALPVAIGTSFDETEITPIVLRTFQAIGFDPEHFRENERTELVYQNVQALTRKHVEFARANQHGIVLATGDYSESLVGWCTFGADQFGYFNLNGNVGKTLVEHLIRWSATNILTADSDAEARELLLRALELEITPELMPPSEDGTIAQKTQDTIGPMELLDFYGEQFVRFSRRPATIARMALHAFDGRTNPLTGVPYTLYDIRFWLEKFLRRFFAAQAKRAATPEGVKIVTGSLDPRGDWRMPSDVKPDLWLSDLANIPVTLEASDA